MQVAIEAMILSVKLADSNKLGVNFELLKDRNNARIISGVPPNSLAAIDVNSGGLKVDFLNGNTTVFVEALETVGDTNIIATPRLLALNKQKAEILIGSQLGYVNTTQTETAATQSVEFLEVGTQLRIRPFISTDGLIRMEVHPELSTGRVRVEGGFTLPDKDLTTVTTNVIAQDGSTVVIGGLIREDLDTAATQIPLFGSLPGVGFLFRQKTDKIDRREILVLITPRILYDQELDAEGNQGAMEFHHRQAIRFEKLSPLGKRHISHTYFVKAKHAWAAGRWKQALHLVNLAIHYDPESRAAIDLRADIWEGNPVGDHTLGAPYRVSAPEAGPLDGPAIEPWLLDQLDAFGPSQAPPRHPLDRGVPGPRAQLGAPQAIVAPSINN
jgi:type IV pilus assembly protein PilQ